MPVSSRTLATSPSLLQMLLLGVPTLACAFVNMPLNIVLPAFYAAHTQVTLVQIGAVTTISTWKIWTMAFVFAAESVTAAASAAASPVENAAFAS